MKPSNDVTRLPIYIDRGLLVRGGTIVNPELADALGVGVGQTVLAEPGWQKAIPVDAPGFHKRWTRIEGTGVPQSEEQQLYFRREVGAVRAQLCREETTIDGCLIPAGRYAVWRWVASAEAYRVEPMDAEMFKLNYQPAAG